MDDFKVLSDAVAKGDIQTAVAETQKLLDSGGNVNDILNKGLIATMDEIGERFSKGLIFVPQMLRSAKTMQECTTLLKPYFQEGDITSKGKVLIGTVKGDLHDIGKNLVSMMLESAGFTITDLGINVPPEMFVEKAKEVEPDIVGMSALLRDRVKVIIGGAPVTEKYAQKIEADAYASDAGSAVTKAKKLLGIS